MILPSLQERKIKELQNILKQQNQNSSIIIQMQISQQKSKGTQNPSPFIEKLQEILNDISNSQTIKFNTLEKQIEISSKKKLEKILGKYFRHAKYESFIRQLNWYGFYKVNNPTLHCYKHSNLENGLSLTSIKSRRNTQSRKARGELSAPVLQRKISDQENRHRNSGEENFPSQNLTQNYYQVPLQNQTTQSGIFLAPQYHAMNMMPNLWNMNNASGYWNQTNGTQIYSFYLSPFNG